MDLSVVYREGLLPFWRVQLPRLLQQRDLIVAVHALDPLMVSMTLMLLLATYSFISTTLSGNCSSVDRLWSITPVLYSWIFSVWSGNDPRCLCMALLATLWGARLTFNFWRRGGYEWDGEDYRWAEVRKRCPRWLFPVFNLVVISLFQHALLWALVLPSYMAYAVARVHGGGDGGGNGGGEGKGGCLNRLDYIGAGLMLTAWVGETVADQQQWRFQTEKIRRVNGGAKLTGDYARGFCSTGLFAFSRHPNFFFEQCVWLSFYLFSVAASVSSTLPSSSSSSSASSSASSPSWPGPWVNWTATGAVTLVLLFQGSTALTEGLSGRKYPAYTDYQRGTNRFIPGRPMDWGRCNPNTKQKAG